MTDASDKLPPAAGSEVQGDAKQLAKMLVEVGPLIVFFAVNYLTKNMFYATGLFMVATATALVASHRLFGRIPMMPLVSGALVMVLGGMTLWLQDAVFIKIKPTLVYTLFGSVLLAGLAAGKYFLRSIVGEVFKLTTDGWRLLTIRWALFFFALAILNELVWRNFSDDFWIAFKLIGAIPLTIGFGVAQLGLMRRFADPAAAKH